MPDLAVVVHLRELQERARRGRIGVIKPDREGVYRTQHASYRLERLVTKGLKDPWSVDFLPPSKDGSRPMLVTEKPGRCASGRTANSQSPSRTSPTSATGARAGSWTSPSIRSLKRTAGSTSHSPILSRGLAATPP